MLVELRIKNFAIIESLSIALGPGLNIFTGETGAGKSIIVDAIALVLGDRATGELIRSSEEEALVEALFDAPSNVEGVIKEAGIETSDNLVIKRIVQRAGRNRIYINGSLATLVTLTEVGRRLIDICGQSEHVSFTRPEEHIEALDSFGDLTGLREEMAEAYRAYHALKKELDSLQSESKNLSVQRDTLSFQSKEISDGALRPGEEEGLNRDKERLRNAERIKGAVSSAEHAIYSDSGAVVERLGAVAKALKEVCAFDDRLSKTAESIEACLFQLEDAGAFLRDYSRTIEHDPGELDRIMERLDLINRLKKKYGPGIREILDKKEAIDKELSVLVTYEERTGALEASVKAARDKAALVAGKLTKSRLKAAGELAGRIEEELSGLGMKGVAFEPSIDTDKNPDDSPRLSEKGSDRVVFYISTNPGEGLKPLARIASGGELSRIMLAMKRVTASGRVPTLVFDEIDAGVGGAAAQYVGTKLKEVSRTHQVLCITHLPQIAAFADNHYSVTKRVTPEGRTVTAIKELNGEESLEQISLMLGGSKVTEVTRNHAGELIEAARKLSKKKSPAAPDKGSGKT